MRIIAGAFRGHSLTAVGKGDAAAHLRPTTDRVRESLFNVLNAYVDWEGKRVLDLFAGTGALGLEALSRGASSVTFVENGRVAQRILSENIKKLRVEDRVHVLRRDATRLGSAEHPHDLIFLDPPYGKALGDAALTSAQSGGWCGAQAVIVWEENAEQTPLPGFEVLDQRRYGSTVTTLLRAP